MKEFLEYIKSILDVSGEFAEVVLNALSLIFIVLGAVVSLVRSFQYDRKQPGAHPLHIHFRMIFGGWLIVALQFQLAADIVGTIISPTVERLIELGAIALIRTFLNYFLNKELLQERELERAGVTEH